MYYQFASHNFNDGHISSRFHYATGEQVTLDPDRCVRNEKQQAD